MKCAKFIWDYDTNKDRACLEEAIAIQHGTSVCEEHFIKD